jgi:hypothetical protein
MTEPRPILTVGPKPDNSISRRLLKSPGRVGNGVVGVLGGV